MTRRVRAHAPKGLPGPPRELRAELAAVDVAKLPRATPADVAAWARAPRRLQAAHPVALALAVRAVTDARGWPDYARLTVDAAGVVTVVNRRG